MTSDPATLAGREPPRPKTKRVYKTVSVDENGGAFRVLLDGRSVLTPLRKPVSTPYRALAEALAAEWDAQNPHIEPENMPLTRLMSTALDHVAPGRESMIDELMKYVDADLLCYRASYPADLKARQHAVWQPVLDWLEGTLGVALITGEGLLPFRQSQETGRALRAAMAVLDDERFTAFQASAAVTSSLALSLALVHGHITAAEAFASSVLDETYQMERWGQDELALRRRRHIEADMHAIGRYLDLLKA